MPVPLSSLLYGVVVLSVNVSVFPYAPVEFVNKLTTDQWKAYAAILAEINALRARLQAAGVAKA